MTPEERATVFCQNHMTVWSQWTIDELATAIREAEQRGATRERAEIYGMILDHIGPSINNLNDLKDRVRARKERP